MVSANSQGYIQDMQCRSTSGGRHLTPASGNDRPMESTLTLTTRVRSSAGPPVEDTVSEDVHSQGKPSPEEISKSKSCTADVIVRASPKRKAAPSTADRAGHSTWADIAEKHRLPYLACISPRSERCARVVS